MADSPSRISPVWWRVRLDDVRKKVHVRLPTPHTTANKVPNVTKRRYGQFRGWLKALSSSMKASTPMIAKSIETR